MKKLNYFISGLLAMSSLIGFSSNANREQEIKKYVDKHFLPLVSKNIEKNKRNNKISIAVIKGSKTYFFNYLDEKKDQKDTPTHQSIYPIGSVGKVFTTIAIADLILKNKAKIDSPIGNWLPELKGKDASKITLKNLLKHQSGLEKLPSNFYETVKDPYNPYINYTESNLIEYLSKLKIDTNKKHSFQYSNTGFGILGLILAKAKKSSYEDAVKNSFLTKLSMSDTKITLDASQKKRVISGYYNQKPTPFWDSTDAMAGSGAFYSTTADLAKLVSQYLNKSNRELKKTLDYTIHENQKEISMVALGWHIEHMNGQKNYWHDGITPSSNSLVIFNKEKNVGIAVLSNNTWADVKTGALIDKIARPGLDLIATLCK